MVGLLLLWVQGWPASRVPIYCGKMAGTSSCSRAVTGLVDASGTAYGMARHGMASWALRCFATAAACHVLLRTEKRQ